MKGAAVWLAQVRHDLVKRLLWAARDRRGLGGPVGPGELAAALIDDEGVPVTAAALWRSLRSAAPETLGGAVLDAFGTAVDAAVLAARADDVDGVLNLEAAFAVLADAAADRSKRKTR